jgi:O-antigen/teichoic acid export membrane protein
MNAPPAGADALDTTILGATTRAGTATGRDDAEHTTALARADMLHSLRNAAKLGMSLVLTWAVALGVRLVLPRHLGPETFGAFQFADAITAMLFVLTGFGMETYIRKEVATRPEHASEFLGGVHVLRVGLSALLVLVLMLVLARAGKPALVQRLVLVMALAQLLVTTNATYAALLHSVGRINGLSVLNVASKVLWGAGILGAFAIGKGVEYVAWALVLSELVKLGALALVTRRSLGFREHISVRGTAVALAASLPFFLGDVARTAFAKVDVSVLSFLTSDLEVGWYSAAANLGSLTMLITPLIGWVLLPLMSRAAARSEEELATVTRRAMELILAASIPITLLLWLGSDVLVSVVFGAAFAPATRSLRILAPMFVLTYVAIVSAMTLVRLERGWTVTAVSMFGLLIAPLLSWYAVPRISAALGPGGAGVGAASVLVAVETVMTIVLTSMVARWTFDRRTGIMLGKTVLVCAAVVALDRALSSFGMLRLIADAMLYAVLVVAVKAVDIPEIIQFVRRAAAHRGEGNEQYA